MSHETTSANIKVHDKFGPGNGADIIFQSSDNVQFHVHLKYLDFAAGAFPERETTSAVGEVVHLPETADVLEILFEFAYPRRHPTMEDLPRKKLLRVAEAAEKYDFRSAAPICQIVLRRHISIDPLEIFRLAVKHDYPDSFIDEVAIELCPMRIRSTLDPRTHASVAPAWTMYHQSWQDIFKKVCERYPYAGRDLLFDDLDHDPEQPEMPYNPEMITVYDLHPCDQCYFALVAWISRLGRSESLASIQHALSRIPSEQECFAVLNNCTCPAPYKAPYHNKTAQTYAVIRTIAADFLAEIQSMKSFAALMRQCRGS